MKIPLATKRPCTPGPWDIGSVIIRHEIDDTVHSGKTHARWLDKHLDEHPELLSTGVRYEAASLSEAVDLFEEVWDDFAVHMTARMGEVTPKMTDVDRERMTEVLEDHGLWVLYLEMDDEVGFITFFVRDRTR